MTNYRHWLDFASVRRCEGDNGPNQAPLGRMSGKGAAMNFFVRWLVTALAVAVAVWLVPGVGFVDTGSGTAINIIMFAVVLALLDMSIKPILQFLSLPLTVLTLGIFYLIVNTVMIYLASALANGLFGVGFEIASFGSAFVASIVISIVGALLNGLVKD